MTLRLEALIRSSPRKRGPTATELGSWIPGISASTRVFDALCAGMNGIARRDFVLALAGTAIAWPLAARAQQGGKIPTVGYLWYAGSADEETPYFGALREGFARLGYVEGRNLKLEHRFPNEMPERFKRWPPSLWR